MRDYFLLQKRRPFSWPSYNKSDANKKVQGVNNDYNFPKNWQPVEIGFPLPLYLYRSSAFSRKKAIKQIIEPLHFCVYRNYHNNKKSFDCLATYTRKKPRNFGDFSFEAKKITERVQR